jgi:hypothetical protein
MRVLIAVLRAGLLALGLGGAGAASGCFHPDKPACAFSCVEPPYTCPDGFTCGADGLCHDPASTGLCTIEPVEAGTQAADANDR